MPVFEWVGNEHPVAQVYALRIGQINPLEEFTLTINNKSLTYTVSAAGTETEQDVVFALRDLWNNSTYPECADAIAAEDPVDVTDMLLTASVPGRPFTISWAGNITNVLAKEVANRGPNVWGLAGNYINRENGEYMNETNPAYDAITGDPDSVFVPGDEIHVRDERPAILYGLNNWENVTSALNLLRIDMPFTGNVGLPPQNPAGYNEYRPLFLTQRFSAIDLGRGEGSGSSLIHLRLGDVKCDMHIFNSGTRTLDDRQAIQLDGFGANSTIVVDDGEVDLARDTEAGGSLLWAQLYGGTLRLYEYCALAGVGYIDVHGGTLWSWANVPATVPVNLHGGTSTFQHRPSFELLSTLTLDGAATVTWNMGNIATLVLDHPSASIDFSSNKNSVTVTTADLKRGSLVRGDCALNISSSIFRGTANFTEP